MARTRKSIQSLNLYKYDVLIEDRGTRSDYFKISQFDGYFYGGRNAFLIAGASVLKPNSKILVEILNVEGTVVYSAPVAEFVEGNSRLIKVEVYNDTPIGAGKIVILGSTDTYIDGTPIPEKWKDKYNVRWITNVIISPLVQNKTPIRFVTPPSLTVEEKFYRIPSSSTFTQNISVPLDIELTPKNYNVFQNGYQIKLIGENQKFISDYTNGILTGSIKIVSSTGTETANILLPLTRIFNDDLGESQGSLIYTNANKLIVNGVISSSGNYTTQMFPFGLVNVTSSLNLQYNKLETIDTGSAVSYAKLRITDVKTLSGEIHKVRVSYKITSEPGDYVVLSDVLVGVQELFVLDSGSRVVETGVFKNINRNDFWYTATMSLQKNESTPTLPTYYNSSSLVGNNIPEVECCQDLLDAINVTPTIVNQKYINNVSYFIGNRKENPIQLFPRSEYTLKFDAIVSKNSQSVLLDQQDYSLEVYLVPQEGSTTKLLDTNSRGQLLGTLTPVSTFGKQNFENTEFNFIPKIIENGEFGIRFVVYGGFWNIANISLKPAEEKLFSPDEIELLIPNVNYADKILSYKIEYLDVNNNSPGIETISIPTYFTGSETTTGGTPSSVASSSYAATASFITHQNPGNNRIITSVTSGSLTGEPNLQFDGSILSVTGSVGINTNSPRTNLDIIGLTSIESAFEKATVSASATSGTINYDILNQSVLVHTLDATGNWTLNVRGNSTTTLNSLLSIGQSTTFTFLVKNGSPAYYQTTFQIDDTNTTINWQGGSIPSAGNVNSIDVYSFVVIKTANSTYIVLGSQTRFA